MEMMGELLFFICFSIIIGYGILDRIHYACVRKPLRRQIEHTIKQISAANRIIGRYTQNQQFDPQYETHVEEMHDVIDLLTLQLKYREFRKDLHKDIFSSFKAWITNREEDEKLQRLAEYNVDVRLGNVDITKTPYRRG